MCFWTPLVRFQMEESGNLGTTRRPSGTTKHAETDDGDDVEAEKRKLWWMRVERLQRTNSTPVAADDDASRAAAASRPRGEIVGKSNVPTRLLVVISRVSASRAPLLTPGSPSASRPIQPQSGRAGTSPRPRPARAAASTDSS